MLFLNFDNVKWYFFIYCQLWTTQKVSIWNWSPKRKKMALYKLLSSILHYEINLPSFAFIFISFIFSYSFFWVTKRTKTHWWLSISLSINLWSRHRLFSMFCPNSQINFLYFLLLFVFNIIQPKNTPRRHFSVEVEIFKRV